MDNVPGKLKQFGIRCVRIALVAPVAGAIAGVREAWDLPDNNWQDLFANSARRYFSPLTGAIRGVSKEYRYGGKNTTA